MIVQQGATNVTTYIMIVDSVTGAPETGVTIANLDMQYTRNVSAPAAKVDMTALATTSTAHTDNRGIEIDATSSPGLYRVDWPDAAFASGADKVILVVTGTGYAPAVLLVELVNYNPQDGVRLGLTALPNAAADAAGGLIISDAGGLDADAQLVTKINDILTDTGTDGVVVAAASKSGYSLTATTGLGNQTANITGNLSGSVGSVTGAVGSVTGAVGSVTGSVGSVASGGITAASFGAGAVDAAALAPDAVNEIADGLLDRDMSTGADSGSTTVRTVRQALRFLRNKWSISGTTLTITKEDDTTASWTATVTTDAAADPITAADPAGP